MLKRTATGFSPNWLTLLWAKARAELEKLYCLENGRTAIEPVLMLGVSILQDCDGVPDRQAVEMLRYHAGWNFA
ncbi:MAG: transposase [Verrucomicrobiia bacterium]